METLTTPGDAYGGGTLETFLRGMETFSIFAVPERAHSLETFLRGMETSTRCRSCKSPRSLKPSLEGWKHAPSMPGQRLAQSLETFLRGMETVGARPAAHASRLP